MRIDICLIYPPSLNFNTRFFPKILCSITNVPSCINTVFVRFFPKNLAVNIRSSFSSSYEYSPPALRVLPRFSIAVSSNVPSSFNTRSTERYCFKRSFFPSVASMQRYSPAYGFEKERSVESSPAAHPPNKGKKHSK